jgi:FKBP-type peptidyl-prolyl cis-trans isomerase SlpA
MSHHQDSIRVGSFVTLHFRLTLEDGTLVDETDKDDPLQFLIGDGTMIEGLEFALYGLRAGDKQTLAIPPETGFGFRDPAAITQMPLSDFPPGIEPVPGRIIEFNLPDGEEIPGAILEIENEQVTVDFNHPCAGHTVTFEVEVIDVRNPPDATLN